MSDYEEVLGTFPDRSDWTMPAVLRARAASHGNRTFLQVPHEGASWTFREVLDRSTLVAESLLGTATPGDRVLIMAENSSRFLFTVFGIALAGLVEVPINTAYHGSFLEHQASNVEPAVAVIDAGYATRFVDSAEACRTVRHFFLIGSVSEVAEASAVLSDAGFAASPWATLTNGGEATLPEVMPQELASVFFTSGTTGPSKGVMMPHAQMYFFADECVAMTRLTDEDTYLCVGPLFHGNAQFLAAYPALVAGARLVLQQRFSASQWTTWVRDSGATVTNFIGVMMDFVWKQPPRPDDADHQMRCIFAAPTAHSYADAFKERFGVEEFVEGFGLTETSMPIISPYGEPRPPGAIGRQWSRYFDIRIVNPETDEEVPVGEVGELVVRPVLPWTSSSGYYRMPKKTTEAFRNLWFHTGDALRRDTDGWYYFIDRISDSLRRRGENISSYEIEQALLEHAGIAECAVVAAPADVEAGEDEVLVAVIAQGNLAPHDVWAWAEKRLPSFAIPRYILFVDELPKTPSSKVQKKEIRALGITGAFDRLT